MPMICLEKPVPDELKGLVSCIIYMRQDLSKDGQCFYLHPPTPETGICFHFRDRIKVLKPGSHQFEIQPQTLVVGPQISPVLIQPVNTYSAVRVGLKPGALYRLTGVPQTELVDQSFDAKDFFGKKLTSLNKQLCKGGGPDAALDLILDFLLSLIPGSLPGHILDEQMYTLWSDPDQRKMEDIAKSCGLSLRQFERLSLLRLGIRPKLYGKIIRFSKAYRTVERNEYQNWTDLAYMNNYYDSRHLKKDFRNFTGRNLKILQKEISQTPFFIQSHLNYGEE